MNRLYRGDGGTRRDGSLTLPRAQHTPNSGWLILDNDNFSSSQWRASQKEQHIFISPKSWTCKLSTKGRCAIQNNGPCAIIVVFQM